MSLLEELQTTRLKVSPNSIVLDLREENTGLAQKVEALTNALTESSEALSRERQAASDARAMCVELTAKLDTERALRIKAESDLAASVQRYEEAEEEGEEESEECERLEVLVADQTAARVAAEVRLASANELILSQEASLSIERQARQALETRLVALTAQAMAPRPELQMEPMPEPPEYMIEVVARDELGNIKQARLRPVK